MYIHIYYYGKSLITFSKLFRGNLFALRSVLINLFNIIFSIPVYSSEIS